MPYDPARDLNGDGKLDIADAVWLLRFLTESPDTQMPDPAQLEAADTDQDGMLTLLDVTRLLARIYWSGTL